jgi:hypothetical protein
MRLHLLEELFVAFPFVLLHGPFLIRRAFQYNCAVALSTIEI